MRWSPRCTVLALFVLFCHTARRAPVAGLRSAVSFGGRSSAFRAPSSYLADCNNRRHELGCPSGLHPHQTHPSASGPRCLTDYPRRKDVRRSSTRLWMSAPAPPVKPPKKRGYGGGGGGDEFFVRELTEPEKSRLLSSWRAFAKADGGAKFFETIEIIDNIVSTGLWGSFVCLAMGRIYVAYSLRLASLTIRRRLR